MKHTFVTLLTLLLIEANLYPQPSIDSIFNITKNLYKAGKYTDAATQFDKLYSSHSINLSGSKLYDGACIYALNSDSTKALNILEYLVTTKLYSNYNHITTDSDLKSLHSNPKWEIITNGAKLNLQTLPERIKKKVVEELQKAKKILDEDNGKLWGEHIWNEQILILANDNTVYSIYPFPDSKTNDSTVFYAKVPENTFGFSNSAQEYKGKIYAIIMTNYLADNSSTIIHELFHILQGKHKNLNGNPLVYLDNYDAREWLRLEYQALRNCLSAIDKKQHNDVVIGYCNDAIRYRKLRQARYKEFRAKEIEIETSEGLANYTGYTLSSYPNKYQIAIDEVNMRETANTYTRAFPYATGLAYGLIFDFLRIDWKKGLDTTYDFLNIYESKYLGHKVAMGKREIAAANKENNFANIHNQELERKITAEKNIAFYKKQFLKQPTLTVVLKDNLYGRTFDMNGTVVLDGIGIVYTSIVGIDGSGKNFGNFKTYPEKDTNRSSCILASFDSKKFYFPQPFKVSGNKIIGETYEIELNNGWTVMKKNDKGDFEIIEIKQ